VAVISVNRTVNGVFQSADSTTLSIRNTAGTVVLATTVVTPVAEGQYSYTSPALAAGNYSAIWTFNVAGYAPDVLVRPFTVDAPIEVSEGVRLMDIERAVARQCGTYRRVRAGAGGTTTAFFANRLKSSQNLGSFEAEFVLRRGLYWDNTLVTNFSDDDRVRGIAPATRLPPGRSGWTTSTPSRSRLTSPSRSCIWTPRKSFAWRCSTDWLAASSGTRSLCLRPDLWRRHQRHDPGPLVDEPPVDQGHALLLPGVTLLQPESSILVGALSIRQERHAQIVGAWPGTIEISVLRPHISFVNGETSYAGPNSDLDVLYLDLEYAVAAGVIGVWKNFPERISPVATQEMRIARKDAALSSPRSR
jgi:hypothetical protein